MAETADLEDLLRELTEPSEGHPAATWRYVLLASKGFKRLPSHVTRLGDDEHYIKIPGPAEQLIKKVVKGVEGPFYIPNAGNPFFSDSGNRKNQDSVFSLMKRVHDREDHNPLTNDEFIDMRNWRIDSSRAYQYRANKQEFEVEYTNGTEVQYLRDVLAVPERGDLQRPIFQEYVANSTPSMTVAQLVRNCVYDKFTSFADDRPIPITALNFKELDTALSRATNRNFVRNRHYTVLVQSESGGTVRVEGVRLHRSIGKADFFDVALEKWASYIFAICKLLCRFANDPNPTPPTHEMILDLYDGQKGAFIKAKSDKTSTDFSIPPIKQYKGGKFIYEWSEKYGCDIPMRESVYICAFNQEVPPNGNLHLEVQMVGRWLAADAALPSLSTLARMCPDGPVRNNQINQQINNMRLPALVKGDIQQRQLFDERTRTFPLEQKGGVNVTAPDDFLPNSEIVVQILVKCDGPVELPTSMAAKLKEHTPPEGVAGKWYTYGGSVTHKDSLQLERDLRKKIQLLKESISEGKKGLALKTLEAEIHDNGEAQFLQQIQIRRKAGCRFPLLGKLL